MAPHAEVLSLNGMMHQLPGQRQPQTSPSPPRLLIIGAGSRGSAYAEAIAFNTKGICVGVVDPIAYKRQKLGKTYIWGKAGPSDGQEFADWKDFIVWEKNRRERLLLGESVPEGVDGVFVCVQDEMHKDVVVGLAPLGLHIMCEKPLATNLEDCVSIYRSLLPGDSFATPPKIFSIGHVLRYSPHNMLLRKLLLEDKVIGEIVSVNHTEPVGWWHFAHSYVRGNWRKESTSAPSLLTKSCHDMDLLLWLLCSPPPNSILPAHLPSTVTSSGQLNYFRKDRKPKAAGEATNCLSCNYEVSCKYSAKRVYVDGCEKSLATSNTEWPVDVVLPEIEDYIAIGGREAGQKALLAKLQEDYDETIPSEVVEKKNWFGRCVYESDNDVCDNQTVTITWDDDPLVQPGTRARQQLMSRGAKTATLHMVAFTKEVCERYTHIYGTDGEIYADSTSIAVQNFSTDEKETHYPPRSGGGHGGGDEGLTRQFVCAIDQVKNYGQGVAEAQVEYIGCTLEEIIRSHAMVFAAEEARRSRISIDFPTWWKKEVESRLG